MRSRYSKTLKRRALWEREDSPLWPWRSSDRYWRTRYCDYKPPASEAPTQEGATQDEHAGHRTLRNSVQHDFEAFKAAIDRAIAEDPYGTLFGRRFRNRPTSSGNHGSWTSLWTSSSNEKKVDDGQGAVKPGSAQENQPLSANDQDTQDFTKTTAGFEKVQHSSFDDTSSLAAHTDKKSTDSAPGEDYEFDPISMRKVPIKKPDDVLELKRPLNPVETTPPAAADDTRKPLLESLFSEHGVNIPVKTYKPHKVYGYDSPEKGAEKTEAKATPTTFQKGLDSSTKREFRNLMARVKGNSIDTTAQFTERNLKRTADEDAQEDVSTKRTREFPELDDDAPLFSGTTYEARSHDGSIAEPGKQDWLAREGFRPRKDGSDSSPSEAVGTNPVQKYAGFRPVNDESQSTKPKDEMSEGVSIKTSVDKLEPALDRIQAKISNGSNDAPFRLETSLDRRSNTKRSVPEIKRDTQDANPLTPPISASEEDMDLLRASDVRAATRSARLTKQEKDDAKNDAREKLEADFVARQNEKIEINSASAPSSTGKLAKSLNTVWDHVREYPDGIVAKTMKSVEAFNSNYKKYIRPDKGLTEKLVFKDSSLSKVASIYKDKTGTPRSKPFTPSPEVVRAEEERELRTAALKEETDKVQRESEKANTQLSRLSQDIQTVYEDEYGAIDVNHRQPTKADDAIEAPLPSSSPATPKDKPHPLLSASVKPGVTTSHVIDKHVREFEPRYAELVDKAKQLRKAVSEAHSELETIRSRFQPSSTSWGAVLDGTKEVRRELHEVKQAIRALESGRPATVWNAPNAACSNFGRKRIDLRTEEASVSPAATAEISGKGVSDQKDGKQSSTMETVEQATEKSVPEPIFTPPGSPEWNDEQPPSVESLRTKNFDSAYVILAYDSAAGRVEISPMNEPSKQSSKSADAVGILAKLNHAPEFLKHFTTLKRAGYSLFNGSEDMLILKKKQPEILSGLKSATSTAAVATPTANPEAAPEITRLPKDVAAESNSVKDTAASTGVPSRPSAAYDNLPKVRRQESVFSGTLRPGAAAAASSSGGGSDGYTDAQTEANGPAGTEYNLWKRVTRGLRRAVLTIAALGGGAYAIGFIAEGMGAQAQKQNGIDDGLVHGARKRIVMTGQRPGIFSTESSR